MDELTEVQRMRCQIKLVVAYLRRSGVHFKDHMAKFLESDTVDVGCPKCGRSQYGKYSKRAI